MDEIQLAAIVAISAGAGFGVASVRFGRQLDKFRASVQVAVIESTSRLTHAALATMHEDYAHPVEEAKTKLFARCAALGMQMVKINAKTGEASQL